MQTLELNKTLRTDLQSQNVSNIAKSVILVKTVLQVKKTMIKMRGSQSLFSSLISNHLKLTKKEGAFVCTGGLLLFIPTELQIEEFASTVKCSLQWECDNCT